MGFDDADDLDALVPAALLKRSTLPYGAAFLAGKRSWATPDAGGNDGHPFLIFSLVRSGRATLSAPFSDTCARTFGRTCH